MKKNKKIIRACHSLINMRFYNAAKNRLLKYIATNNSIKDAEIYGLLGQISLLQKDVRAAENYIHKALLIDRNNITALLAKSVAQLMLGGSEEALRIYFTILAIEPDNKIAKANINRIKNNNKFDINIDVRKYLVYKKMPPVQKFIILILLVSFLAAVAYLSINIVYPKIYIMFLDEEQKALRKRLEDVYLFDGLENVDMAEGQGSFSYSPQEIADMFNLAKEKIGQADVNAAMQIINTALHSDINQYLKEQFERLSLFITAPDYTSFKNNISYQTVIENPNLYIGSFVKWTVVVQSILPLENGDEGENTAVVIIMSDDGKTALGLAEIIYSLDTKLQENQKIEVYARIKNFDIRKKMTILNSIVIKHLPN